MSKRRKRNKKVNLPEATLKRAREQAGLAPDEEISDVSDAAIPVHEEVAPEVSVAASTTKRSRRRRDISRKQMDKDKREEIEAEQVAELLANPTKAVSEEELQQEYGYVIRDIRNMAILAVVLFIFLIAMAQFL